MIVEVTLIEEASIIDGNLYSGYTSNHYGYFEVDSVEEAERIFHDSLDKRWFIEEIEIQELPENIVLANEA